MREIFGVSRSRMSKLKLVLQIDSSAATIRHEPPATSYMQYRFMVTNREIMYLTILCKAITSCPAHVWRPVVKLIKINFKFLAKQAFPIFGIGIYQD